MSPPFPRKIDGPPDSLSLVLRYPQSIAVQKKNVKKKFSEKVWEVKNNRKKRVLVCSCGLLAPVEAHLCFVFDKNSLVLKVTDHGLPCILYLGLEFIQIHSRLSSLPVSVQLLSGPSLSPCIMFPHQLTPNFSPDVQRLRFSSLSSWICGLHCSTLPLQFPVVLQQLVRSC